jgi:large subunit ribosomal protein L5
MSKLKPLQTVYAENIAPALATELGIQNVMAVPKMTKVKVSVGIGKIARKSSGQMDDAKIAEISENIAMITGQKPTVNLSRKAISNFKLRAGMPIGISVTLRGQRMYDFISRLVGIALPRVRDFRGISPKGFDGHGNYSMGMKDFTVFPEVPPEKADWVHGLEITIVTSAKDDTGGRALLTALGFPFQKKDNQ